MGDPITRDEWNRLLQTIDQGFAGVNARLDRQNGRLGEAEYHIGILSDRSNSDRQSRWFDRIVAFVAAVALGVAEYTRR